nr:hypothetical protein [uncultured Pseudomonas sp.]
MSSRLILAIILLFALQGTAHASCSRAEATALAERLANRIDLLTQDDPQRAAQLRKELKSHSPATSAQQLQDSCDAYRHRLRELEQLDGDIDTHDQ